MPGPLDARVRGNLLAGAVRVPDPGCGAWRQVNVEFDNAITAKAGPVTEELFSTYDAATPAQAPGLLTAMILALAHGHPAACRGRSGGEAGF
jgi:hypothetical protein